MNFTKKTLFWNVIESYKALSKAQFCTCHSLSSIMQKKNCSSYISKSGTKSDWVDFSATRGPKQLEWDFKVRLLWLQRDKSGGRGCILQRGGTRQNTSAEKQGDFQPPQTKLNACFDLHEWEKHAITVHRMRWTTFWKLLQSWPALRRTVNWAQVWTNKCHILNIW